MSKAQQWASDTSTMTSLWKYSTPLKKTPSLIPSHAFSTVVSGNCLRFNDCWRKKCRIVWEVMRDDGHRSCRVTLAVIRQSSITVPLRSAVCKLGRRAFNIHLDSACPIIKASIYPVNLHDARHAFTHRLIDGEAVEPWREPHAANKLFTLFVSVSCSALFLRPSKPRILLYRKREAGRMRSDGSRASVVVNRLKEIDRSAREAT